MKTENIKNRTLGITQRTALLSWLVTTGTLLLFVLVIIPQQKRTILENLESKAHGVAVSLHEVAAGAAVNEDFSSVVDHCKEMLNGDQALDYLVITKSDGFSLIHDRTGWHSETNADFTWRPIKREPVSGIGFVPLFNRRVFHYSQPFDYSGIQWGWIHVGLSLDSYDRSVAAVYQRTGMLAIVCIVISLLGSVMYAKHLVRPILSLRQVVRQVASGDLAARAEIDRGDELGSLAGSVNTMTESLRRRDLILESMRFAAQEFLSTTPWETVVAEVLAKVGEAAAISRIHVLQKESVAGGKTRLKPASAWESPTCPPAAREAQQHTLLTLGTNLDALLPHWEKGETLTQLPAGVPPLAPEIVNARRIKSFIVIPIMVEGVWWGVLTLVDCDKERDWTDSEKDSFRAIADMFGAAIERQQIQNALVQAKEAAEAASEAKSQFLANMSHEIRTPITGVMGMLQLLQRTSLDEKQHRYVNNSMTSANALLKVIGDVLDFSKIEAGKMELEKTTFTLPDVLDTAVGLLAERAEAKGLEVACRVAADVPRQLVGDPDRLRQVLLNLLSNAVKFTERGSVIVACTQTEGDAETVTLRFEVQDTGTGIAPQQQALIFEAFCQADNSMSRTHGGTGLGLTICRQLVNLMEGQISVQSVPGQGSTFWFTARFKRAAAANPTAVTPVIVDFRGLRVLVVDDCAVVREIICDYVRTWQGLPEAAPEAATGLEMLRRAAASGTPFGVAVLDWRMPGLDGFALARLVQQEPALRKTGLVLLSSFTQTNLAADCENSGFAAWLPKPARKSELYDAIIRAANGHLSHLSQSLSPTRRPAFGPVQAKGLGTILLAEDNEINQEVASEMLAAMGYQCVRVRTGQEAVAEVKNGQVGLVLMDCQMPEMDGYEATRVIRRWEQQEAPEGRRGWHLPIVALTAHAMTGDRSRCLEAGMDDYLTKPLEPAEMARTLAHWMSRPAVEPAATGTDSPKTGIDFPSLLHRCMDRPELAGRLVQKFLVQAGADVQELETAIREQNAAQVRLVAHRIKGSAANVSAEAVRDSASRLEILGRDANLATAPEIHAQLCLHLKAVKTQINDLPKN